MIRVAHRSTASREVAFPSAVEMARHVISPGGYAVRDCMLRGSCFLVISWFSVGEQLTLITSLYRRKPK